MRTLTKIKAITIVFLFLGLLTSVYFVTQSFAQEPSAEDAGFENVTYKGIDEAYPQIDITKTATGFSSSMLIEPTTFAITGQSSTVAIEEAGKCLEAVQAGGSIDDCGLGSGAYAPSNSLMGATSSLAMMSNPDVIPLNLALYFREQVKDVPIIGAKVYAQGEGRFNNLFGADLAYMLWKTFRNMAYGLVSIFLVVIGIFIMLRKKTDPKTVLTLQAALPKVIISLVLITFSFGSGKLSDNITPEIVTEATSVVLKIRLLDYYDYVNKGVKGVKSSRNAPGSPYQYKNLGMSQEGRASLRKYIESGRAKINVAQNQKGGLIGNEKKKKSLIDAKVDTLAYLIKAFGIKGSKYFEKAFNETFKDLESVLVEAAGADILLTLSGINLKGK